eukprot:TRINITY_DN3861_c0_g1_i1.p1 TRINITY_DN3861_c0_g1~~TRINITY_DN3861_c0_g1_i1.p1  ORF type:complete len:355 (-),score=56.88 TRINITY_DN3861_c0_g1_i1:71-1135(-)
MGDYEDENEYSVKKMMEYEDRFKEGKSVLSAQDVFDGVKIEISRVFDTRFQIVHALKMGGHYELGPQKQKAKEKRMMQGGAKDQFLYEFTASYLHGNFVFVGRIDTQDRMMGRFHHNYNKRFNYKIMGQTIEEHSAAIIEGSFRPTSDSVISVKAINWTQFNAAYMQMVNPYISLGCELQYNSKTQWAINEFSLRYQPAFVKKNPFIGFPAQYGQGKIQIVPSDVYVLSVGTSKGKKVIGPSIQGESYSLAKNVFRNIGSVSFGFAHMVNERCQMASLIKFAKIGQDKWSSSLKVGIDYSVPMLCSFKSQINANGTVTTTLDDTISQNARYAVAAKINYFKSIYKFGISINIFT